MKLKSSSKGDKPLHNQGFVETLESATTKVEPRYRSFAELLFDDPPDTSPDPVVLLGSLGAARLTVTLDVLRRAVLTIIARMKERGIQPGDTVCLLRMPRTSETPIAATYVALSVMGVRVLLPMFLEPERLGRWLDQAGARLLLWSEQEVTEHAEVEADRTLLDVVRRQARRSGVATCCVDRDLGVSDLLRAPGNLDVDGELVGELVRRGKPEDPCLLLTTSGTSGRSKLVLYTQGAFLRCCAAWEEAGLLGDDRLGGRAFCPLFAHSMGVRALWNALYRRSPLCLVTPEWFAEHPERARAFLSWMRPEHVTGGPGVYRTLLELARLFPSLKAELGSIRCAVSSGSPFDPSLEHRLSRALNLSLENALGLTETQQVTSTAVAGTLSQASPCLGNPLPGVRLGLAPGGATPNTFRLHVASPFGASGYLDDEGNLIPLPGAGPWFDTGDLVERTPDGLRYVGRNRLDFFKDGFGVKIPRARVVELYADIEHPVVHVEPFALRDEPGLGALVFVDAPGQPPTQVVPDPALVRRVRGLLMGRLELLRDRVEELEFRHLTISRFVCVAGPAPRTPKGDVSRASLVGAFEPLVRSMSGRFVPGPGRDRIDRDAWIRSSTTRLVSPRRGELLRIARLDQHFVAARGDTLTYRDQGREVEVVDFVGSFGGNLLGHRHPSIVGAVRSFVEGAEPAIGDQGSAQQPAGRLAKSLASRVSRHTGSTYVVRLGSTGAEAVEMAIAHAHLERAERVHKLHRELRQRFGSLDPQLVRSCVEEGLRILEEQTPKILALSASFHGHSLGARSVLGSKRYRRPYAALSRIERIVVPHDTNAGSLDALVRECRFGLPSIALEQGRPVRVEVPMPTIIAAIAEPVMGEGGVREVPRDLLRAMARHDFPLILDEIQCGLGRTGSFLASEGVPGHYYLFAKTLGGGFAKVSALLVERQRYVERFDEHYASTFAGDPLSCSVASAVLDVIEREDVPARAKERGDKLREALERVRDAYPEVFASVRGRGLMQGVEIDPACTTDSFVLRGLARHEHLGALAASVLIHRHRIRVLPTLSAPHTLRVEPSAYVTDAQIELLERALLWLGECLRERRVADLVAHLADDPQPEPSTAAARAPERIDTAIASPGAGAARVGFVNHFITPERELALGEPTLASLSSTQRRTIFHKLMQLLELEPVIGYARNILRDRVWFLSVLNVADAATLESLHRSQDRAQTVQRVQHAVDLAAQHGCQVIALGAYASIITDNGLSVLPPPGTRIISGNTLTVAVAARRIAFAAREAGIHPSDDRTVLGIVGATGNIGAALSHRLLTGPNAFRRAVLVSRSPEHFERLASRLKGTRAEVTYSDDLTSLRSCNVVGLAVNTNEPLLLPHHVGPHATVVGDVSVPGSVSEEVRGAPNVRFVTLAGVVALPGEPGFLMSSHSPQGTAFCCAAEAMLVALEPEATRDLRLAGDVDPVAVARLDELAERHAWLDPLAPPGS